MHDGEVRVDADQVRRLVARQFPRWASLPVTPVPLAGTDHALFRLGEDLVARMPRIEWALDQAASDRRWLPLLAPELPLAVPVPVATGQPGEGYPWEWTVVPWIAGKNPTPANVDLGRAAVDLGAFVAALQRVDPGHGPVKDGLSRGVPLAVRDEITRAAIVESGSRIDAGRVATAWDEALTAQPWSGPGAWLHGDLKVGNLIAHRRRLVAVIDFGGLGLGDPAPDLLPAWNLFAATSRDVFREAVGCDGATWLRGRGWALSTALMELPYYWDRAPAIAAEAQRTIAAVLDDLSR